MKYRFLIDANVSPALEGEAWKRGHEAYHVRTLKREREGDPVLLEEIQAKGYTLGTNNIEEFRHRYRNRNILHAGTIFIAGAERGREYQIGAFNAALDRIETVVSIDDTELFIEPDSVIGYRVTSSPLP